MVVSLCQGKLRISTQLWLSITLSMLARYSSNSSSRGSEVADDDGCRIKKRKNKVLYTFVISNIFYFTSL